MPFQWHIHEAPHDYYRYTNFGLEYMLSKAGFKNIEIIANTGFWVTWILKFNYYSTILIRGPILLRFFMKILLVPIWLLDS